MEFSRYVARAFLMLFTNLFLYTFVLEIYFKKKKKRPEAVAQTQRFGRVM